MFGSGLSFRAEDVPVMKCGHCAELALKVDAKRCAQCRAIICVGCAKAITEERERCRRPKPPIDADEL